MAFILDGCLLKLDTCIANIFRGPLKFPFNAVGRKKGICRAPFYDLSYVKALYTCVFVAYERGTCETCDHAHNDTNNRIKTLLPMKL